MKFSLKFEKNSYVYKIYHAVIDEITYKNFIISITGLFFNFGHS